MMSSPHRYLFFRQALIHPVTTCFTLLDGYTVAWRQPGLLKMVLHFTVSSWKFVIFGWMFFLFGYDLRYRMFTILAPDGSLAHYSIVSPKYFRFPFMNKEDLQIGGLWTEPRYRGLGLATYAVQEILRAEKWPDQVYWYVVAEDNSPSIQIALKNGFIQYGLGFRKKFFGSSLLARFEITKQANPDML